MSTHFYMGFIGLSTTVFLSTNVLVATTDPEEVAPSRRPVGSSIDEIYTSLQSQTQMEKGPGHRIRRMASAAYGALMDRWEEQYPEAYGGGVSASFMRVGLQVLGAFLAKEREFLQNAPEGVTPQEHLDRLHAIAGRFQTDIQAGKYDPSQATVPGGEQQETKE